MDFIQNNYETIILVLGAIYPPLLFVLPPNVANKISLGVKILKIVADSLEKAKDSKAGLSAKQETKENKTFVQKSKS